MRKKEKRKRERKREEREREKKREAYQKRANHGLVPAMVKRRAGKVRRENGCFLVGSGSMPKHIAMKSVNAGRHCEMMTAVLGDVRYTPEERERERVHENV